MKYSLFLTLTILCLGLSNVAAKNPLDVLGKIKYNNATLVDWAQAVGGLADAEVRESVQKVINEIKPFPKEPLVELLSHPYLSVRLGAIELLEDASGGDNSFNAWLEVNHPSNVEPLNIWREWVDDENSEIELKSNNLSPEKVQGYIQQLLSDDPARISRANRMLEGDNFAAVSAIQQFIVDNPSLPAVKLAQLKQSQYELVLIKTTRSNASQLARDLVKGNRDQKLTALARLKKLGLITIPIIRDFVDAPDSLIRETAIDAILNVGGSQTLPYITDILKEEKDVNVIHVAIKNLKDIGGEEPLEIIKSYLTHESEDLTIASISAVTKLIGGENNYSLGSNKKQKDAKPESLEIIKLLNDNRWRVRIAVLEHISKLNVKEAADGVMNLLQTDEDEFVRHHSIKAAVALNLKDATPVLSKLYTENDEMVAPLTSAFIQIKGRLPKELLEHLKSRDPDTIITSLEAFNNDKSYALQILSSFAKDKNIDISCAALRMLSNDEDKVKVSSVANVLTDALTSKNEQKISAVLGSIDLPSSDRVDPSLLYLKGVAKRVKRTKNPRLDPLYNAFLLPDGKALVADGVAAHDGAEATGGLASMIEVLVSLANEDPTSERAFKIALMLTKAGDKRGLEMIKDNVTEMSVSKRASLADAVYNPRQAATVPIILTLLQDPSSDIRSSAVRAAFSNDQNKVLIHKVLNSLVDDQNNITGADAYTYRTDRAASDRKTREIFYQWCVEQLEKEKLSDQSRILSLILIRKIATEADSELIAKFTDHENPWVRRTAWHTLGTMGSLWYMKNLDKLTSDTHPDVRAVMGDVHSRGESRWEYVFSDTVSKRDQSYSSGKDRRRLNPVVEKALIKMADQDVSDSNRFEAMFTLLTHSRTIDLNKFIGLMSKQDKEAQVTDRLTDYVESNYSKMGKGMRPLLAYVDFKQMSGHYVERVIRHFESGSSTSTQTGFATFDALAKSTTVQDAPQHISTPENEDELVVEREKLVVVFFEKVGCKKCLVVEGYLKDMKQDFPMLEVRREFVDDSDGLILNNHLSTKLDVPDTQTGKAPAIFTSSGYLVGTHINPRDLGALLTKTSNTNEEKDWYAFKNEIEIEEAKTKIDEGFKDLTLPIVIAGGLLDGINPCAFATIIFFLSYLTIAKRSPKEIFFVGAAFILAVFLSYLSFGLVFSKLLEILTANQSYQWIRNALNYIFAGFAILVAVLSLRDWWRARQGRLEDMTLQLPNFLKKKIRGVIRDNSKSSLYVLAAFGSGVAISVLELACTGQVYAPIIYKINEGSQDAVTMLIIYNLAFVLPLIIIFGLAMGGMKSNTLISFQKNHTAKIKLMTAILFFLLAAVLLFSTQISAWIESIYPSI